jgi:hypothetical protein
MSPHARRGRSSADARDSLKEEFLSQLLGGVVWDGLDLLIVDMPHGAGGELLGLVEPNPHLDGCARVTSQMPWHVPTHDGPSPRPRRHPAARRDREHVEPALQSVRCAYDGRADDIEDPTSTLHLLRRLAAMFPEPIPSLHEHFLSSARDVRGEVLPLKRRGQRLAHSLLAR